MGEDVFGVSVRAFWASGVAVWGVIRLFGGFGVSSGRVFSRVTRSIRDGVLGLYGFLLDLMLVVLPNSF